MWFRNVATGCQLDKKDCVEWSQLLRYVIGYLRGPSSYSFNDFCFDMQVYSIICFSMTEIMLSRKEGMEASTGVSAVDTPLCKSTHVHMFDILSSQYCRRPAEFRTVCSNAVQRN